MTQEQQVDIRKIIMRAGGYSVVARAVERSRQTVYGWQHVPIRHVKKLAELADLPLRDIRPDVYD